MDHFISQPLVTTLAWTLLHFVWQGAVISAIAAVLWRQLREASPTVRYAVGVASLGAMVLCTVVTFAILSSRSPAVPSSAASAQQQTLAASHVTDHVAAPSMVLVGDHISALSTMLVSSSGQTSSAVSRFADQSRAWLALFVAIWAMGVALLSVRLAGGWLVANRLTRRGVSPVTDEIAMLADRLMARLSLTRAVRLLESSIVRVPTVIGWITPVVLVPASALAGLSSSQLEALLAHELAHIRRHDYLVNVLQSAVETLLFYHPAVWWISRRVRIEREHCCDDVAIDVCGDRAGYAAALATLEVTKTMPSMAVAATGGSLVDRIRRIVGVPPAPRQTSFGWVGAMFILLIVALLSPAAFASRHTGDVAKPVALGDHQTAATAPPSAVTPATSTDQGQQSTSQQSATPVASTAGTAQSPVTTEAPHDDYKIRIGDVLQIKVDGFTDLSRDYAVESDGAIVFPLTLPIWVAGKTTAFVESEVRRVVSGIKPASVAALVDPVVIQQSMINAQTQLDQAEFARVKAQEKYDRLKALDLDNVEVAARDLDISGDAEVVNIRRTIDGLNADYANKIAAGLGPSNSQVKAIESQITQERKLIKEAIQNIVAHANSDLQDKRREVEHWRTNLDGKHEIATAMTNAQAASSKIAITVKVRDAAPVPTSIAPETVVAPFVLTAITQSASTPAASDVSTPIMVNVQGEVKKPGLYPLPANNRTLFQAIVQAGGYAIDHGPEIRIVRRVGGSSSPDSVPPGGVPVESLNVNIHDMEAGVVPSPPLQDGDLIFVLKMTAPLSDTTLSGALALVQGGQGSDADADARLAALHLPGEPRLVPPVAINHPDPKYTAQAMRKKIQGTATVDVTVAPNGTVRDARIKDSLDPVYGLDDQAVATAKTWTFEPGTLDGKPIPVRLTIEMIFKLR